MIKPGANGVRGTGKLEADDVKAFEGLPHWRNFLMSQVYEGTDEERQPGLVIFKATGDGWFFTLKDPSSCLMLKFTGRTFDEALLLGEELLSGNNAAWEADSYEQAKRARSRQKKS